MQLCCSDTPPTAIFLNDDAMAPDAYAAFRRLGLKVGQDIAVVGFDDILLASFNDPPLTTICKSNIEQGRLAGQMLVDLINGKQPVQRQISIDTTLVVRASCGANV